MREAFLSGESNWSDALDTPETDAPKTDAVATGPLYFFESVTLTEDGHIKVTGSKWADGAADEFTIKRDRAPHPDLLKELRRLTLHMALLTEHVAEADLCDGTVNGLPNPVLPPAVAARNALREAVETGEAFVHEKLEPFRCLSVAWKPKGVVLGGTKKTRYRFGKDLEVKTPLTLVMSALDDDAADDDYAFFEQMSNTLAALVSELIAYMNGKYGEGGEQLDLFGKDPAPRTVDELANELMDALDNDRYTVSVGVPGGEMKEVKRKANRVKGEQSND